MPTFCCLNRGVIHYLLLYTCWWGISQEIHIYSHVNCDKQYGKRGGSLRVRTQFTYIKYKIYVGHLNMVESSTSVDSRCLWSLILHLLRKWEPLPMSFSSCTPRHKAGLRRAKSCANSDPMDGVWQPNIVSYFWGQDFLGYKPQPWKALIFHWTLRTGSHLHGVFLDLSASLPWRFSLLLSSVTPTIYPENWMFPTQVSLILPRQGKDQRNIFLLCILSSGAHTMAENPSWTRLTEQSTSRWKKRN